MTAVSKGFCAGNSGSGREGGRVEVLQGNRPDLEGVVFRYFDHNGRSMRAKSQYPQPLLLMVSKWAWFGPDLLLHPKMA